LFASYAAFFLGGTFAPFWRAFERPMAIGRLRLFTLRFPDGIGCISVWTSCPAFLLFLRTLDFLRELLLDFLLGIRTSLC
jgi:hypothetical protein